MPADISTDPADVHMRRNILRTFLDTPADNILLRTRSHTEPAHLNNCYPSYAQAQHHVGETEKEKRKGTRGNNTLEQSHVSASEDFRDNLVRDKCILLNEDDYVRL